MAYNKGKRVVDGNIATLIANAILPGLDAAIQTLEAERDKYRSYLSTGVVAPDEVFEGEAPHISASNVKPKRQPYTVTEEGRQNRAAAAAKGRLKLKRMQKEYVKLGGVGLVSKAKLEALKSHANGAAAVQ